MIKSEENKYSMYTAVKAVLLEDRNTITRIPAFATIFKEYEVLLEDIYQAESQFQNVTKGATATKRETRSELIQKTISIAAAIYVYGRQADIETLKARARLTPSQLKLMRDIDLSQKAKMIMDDLKAELQNLADFGVSESEVSDFQTTINAYDKALAQQGDKTAQKRAAKQRLRELFDQTDEFLKETLDYMIEAVKSENTQLYDKYQIARMIKDL
jgi:hypothetical protein